MAVAHRAGLSCSTHDFDYGIDGSLNEIRSLGKRYFASGFSIDFQAKASSKVEVGSREVIYDLEAKNYNDLIDTKRAPKPFILILLAMPRDQSQWLEITHDAMLLRRCAWWASLRGQPATTNSDSQRIRIPRAQMFDVAAAQSLMDRHKRGEVF